jgi:hypothetical protein
MSNVCYAINRSKDRLVMFNASSIHADISDFTSIHVPYPDALLSELSDAVSVVRTNNDAGEIHSAHSFAMLRETVIKLNNRVVDLVEGESML